MTRLSARFHWQILPLVLILGAWFPCCGEGLGGFLISSEQEVEMGEGVDKELEKEFVIVDAADPVAQWAVQLVVPLQEASKPFRDPTRIGGYKVEVIADDTLINAFAAPGGYVYITTAIIEASSSCAELAGVLGHELAHVTERHGVKQIEGQFAASEILSFFFEDSDELLATAAATIWSFLQSTQFSQAHEAEADEVGLQIAYDAGYNPFGLVDFFTKILEMERQAKEQTGFSVPEFLSSHPATQGRIDDVRKDIERRYGDKVVEGNTQSYDCVGTTLQLADVQKLISEDKVTVRAGTGPSAAPPEDM